MGRGQRIDNVWRKGVRHVGPCRSVSGQCVRALQDAAQPVDAYAGGRGVKVETHFERGGVDESGGKGSDLDLSETFSCVNAQTG